MDPEILRKYFISQKNIIKVTYYRNYDCNNIEELNNIENLTFEEFTEIYKDLSLKKMKEKLSNLLLFTEKLATLEDGYIKLLWYGEGKLGASLGNIIHILEKQNIKRMIVVVDEGVTPGCTEMLRNLRSAKKIIIDVWTLKESMIFVPDHELVPSHRICSTKEKLKLMRTYGLKKQQLPGISATDVMVKYLGASKGQLIEVLRVSNTNPGHTIPSYCIVI
jgi:DNA-directed RNA polymerase I, II, and III subunit RPABC1